MNLETSKPDGAAEPLPSALEVALEKTHYDETPLTSAVIQAITSGARHFPPQMLLDGKIIPFTPGTVAAIVYNGAEPLCSDDVLKSLRDLHCKFEVIINEELPKYAGMAVTPEAQRRQALVHEKVLNGEALGDAITPSREAIAQEFTNRRNALEALLRKLTHEQLVPLAKPILEKFETVVEDFMRGQEMADRANCDAFALEYAPGVLWRAAAAVRVKYQAKKLLPSSFAWVTPKTLLEGIIE